MRSAKWIAWGKLGDSARHCDCANTGCKSEHSKAIHFVSEQTKGGILDYYAHTAQKHKGSKRRK